LVDERLLVLLFQKFFELFILLIDCVLKLKVFFSLGRDALDTLCLGGLDGFGAREVLDAAHLGTEAGHGAKDVVEDVFIVFVDF
jgi:hypothetical protein